MCDSVPCPLQRAVQSHFLDFPIGSDSEESACQAGGRVSIWVEKIPWRKEWLPIIVFLPGEFHQQRSLVGYSPGRCEQLDTTEWLSVHALYFGVSSEASSMPPRSSRLSSSISSFVKPFPSFPRSSDTSLLWEITAFYSHVYENKYHNDFSG